MKNSLALIFGLLIFNNTVVIAQEPTHQQLEKLVETGDVTTLKTIVLSKQIDVNASNPKKNELPLLFEACNGESLEMVRFLLEQGANPNAMSLYGMPASWAAENGNMEAIDLLLDYGFDPKKETLEYWISAYKNKTEEVPNWIQRLISYITMEQLTYKDYPYTQYIDPADPLILAAAIHYDTIGKLALAKRLIKAGSNVNLVDKKGKKALDIAIEDFNVTAVKLLISNGANVNKPIKNEKMYHAFLTKELNDNITPLHYLMYVIQQYPELYKEHEKEVLQIAKALMKAGANPYEETVSDKKNVIQKAKETGSAKLVKIVSKG